MIFPFLRTYNISSYQYYYSFKTLVKSHFYLYLFFWPSYTYILFESTIYVWWLVQGMFGGLYKMIVVVSSLSQYTVTWGILTCTVYKNSVMPEWALPMSRKTHLEDMTIPSAHPLTWMPINTSNTSTWDGHSTRVTLTSIITKKRTLSLSDCKNLRHDPTTSKV